MKIISTKLFTELQTLLEEKIQTGDPQKKDYFTDLLKESNDIDHVAEVKQEIFDHFAHNGELLVPFGAHQQWFDVDDRLPEKYKPVLAISYCRYGGTRSIFQAVYTGDDDRGWQAQSDYDGAAEGLMWDEYASHWTCLPLFPDEPDYSDDSDEPKEETKVGGE